MNERETFLESHRELVGLVRWIGRPMVLVEEGTVSNDALTRMQHDNILFTHGNAGVEVVAGGFNSEMADKILSAFLESHRKLQ